MQPIKNINDKTPNYYDTTPKTERKATDSNMKFPPLYGKITYHIIAFLLYILFEIFVVYMNGERFAPAYYLPYYLLFVFLFYLYAHRIYPTGYHKWSKNKFSSILIFIGSITLTIIVLITFNHISRYLQTGEISVRTHPQTLTNAIWRSFVLFNLSAMYWLAVNTAFKKQQEINMLQKQKELEREAFESQLAYEHARINPHFLFNTLQYIYRIVEPLSSKAETAIANLVDMMRLLLASLPSDHKISLEQELYTVELYITMSQQLRENRCYCTFKRPESEIIEDFRIPPQIILTLAENLFKHGMLSDPGCPAILNVTVEGNILTVHLKNRKYAEHKHFESGIGMQNLRSRLNYFYPENYTLEIRERNEIFELNLVIPL